MELSGDQLQERLGDIYHRHRPPSPEELASLVERVNEVLDHEPGELRPHDSSGSPGGLLYLKTDIPTVVVPDLHARLELLLCLMRRRDGEGSSTIESLESGRVQVVCVGDGFHAEGRAVQRWQVALEEFRDDYEHHHHMDLEMEESFGVMEMVMELKSAYPGYFHFLKGNHENITNQLGDGNYPFRKYAHEGQMVTRYVEKFYGRDLLRAYDVFEKRLPLLAVGRNFLISHAEPEFFLTEDEIIEYRREPEVVAGLTWTPNDGAQEGSVEEMLAHYLGHEDSETAFYFGGHRPVEDLYKQRAGGRYVQIHNPDKYVVALLPGSGDIDLGRDIVEIGDQVLSCREELDRDAVDT